MSRSGMCSSYLTRLKYPHPLVFTAIGCWNKNFQFAGCVILQGWRMCKTEPPFLRRPGNRFPEMFNLWLGNCLCTLCPAFLTMTAAATLAEMTNKACNGSKNQIEALNSSHAKRCWTDGLFLNMRKSSLKLLNTSLSKRERFKSVCVLVNIYLMRGPHNYHC